MSWRTRKNGRRYFKKPSTGRIPSPLNPPKKPTRVYFDDKNNRKRRDEFARKKAEEFNKRKKAKKKQERFNRVIHLDLGHAKGFLIKATPVLVQLDPTLSSIYSSYKVGKYGYCFLKQVDKDYQKSGNFEESLKTVVEKEIEKKIISKIKSITIQKLYQHAANRIWILCKEKFSDEKIDPKWDEFAENALVNTFQEIGEKLL